MATKGLEDLQATLEAFADSAAGVRSAIPDLAAYVDDSERYAVEVLDKLFWFFWYIAKCQQEWVHRDVINAVAERSEGNPQMAFRILARTALWCEGAMRVLALDKLEGCLPNETSQLRSMIGKATAASDKFPCYPDEAFQQIDALIGE